METTNSVLYFNPDSTSPRRFTLPVSLGRLVISDSKMTAEIFI